LKNKVLVTGCAGFIGSHMSESLLAAGKTVVGVDNFRTGQRKFLDEQLKNENFSFLEMDLKNSEQLGKAFENVETVFHFAANADVRFGKDFPRRDLEENTIATHNVLEAMRLNDVEKIVFSSTGSIYGDSIIVPTPENSPFPIQTSLYGASKLACEGLIEAYCESFGMKSWIYRFVSILGPRYSHGHVYDFVSKLKSDPTTLEVLGNGFQRKSYLHIDDCISGINLSMTTFNEKVNIINLGFDGTCTVRDSINWIIEELGIHPIIFYGDEIRGWVGDSPLIHLATDKIKTANWTPQWTIESSVKDTVRYLKTNGWLF
jgi:UDP-glucose 4-epimerase